MPICNEYNWRTKNYGMSKEVADVRMLKRAAPLLIDVGITHICEKCCCLTTVSAVRYGTLKGTASCIPAICVLHTRVFRYWLSNI